MIDLMRVFLWAAAAFGLIVVVLALLFIAAWFVDCAFVDRVTRNERKRARRG